MTVKDADVNIPGYNAERKDRMTDKSRGGVIVYVNDTIPFKRRHDIELLSDPLECEQTELTFPKAKPILVCNAYGPPNTSIKKWIGDFKTALEKAHVEGNHIIFMG